MKNLLVVILLFSTLFEMQGQSRIKDGNYINLDNEDLVLEVSKGKVKFTDLSLGDNVTVTYVDIYDPNNDRTEIGNPNYYLDVEYQETVNEGSCFIQTSHLGNPRDGYHVVIFSRNTT